MYSNYLRYIMSTYKIILTLSFFLKFNNTLYGTGSLKVANS